MTHSQKYRYQVVDVFTDRPLEGNPLAVFLDGTELDGATMQSIARELNLSETVFVLPPREARYLARLRIFTPRQELAFGGHPTIGTGFVLLTNEIVPRDVDHFVLEEEIGPVPVRVQRGKRPLIWLTTPPIESGQTFDRDLCARMLGLSSDDLLDGEPQSMSAGNPFIFVAVKSKDIVDRAWLDADAGRSLLTNVRSGVRYT